MAQVLYLLLEELAFLRLQHQSSLAVGGKNPSQTLDVMLERRTVDARVIQVGQGHLRRNSIKNFLNQPTVGCRRVAKSERHLFKLVKTPGGRESGLRAVGLFDGDDVVSPGAVDAAEDFAFGQAGEICLDVWKRE